MYKNIGTILEGLRHVNEESTLPGKYLSRLPKDVKDTIRKWYLIDLNNSKFTKISNVKDIDNAIVDDYGGGFVLVFNDSGFVDVIKFSMLDSTPHYSKLIPIGNKERFFLSDVNDLIKGNDAYVFYQYSEDNKTVGKALAQKQLDRYAR